MALRPGDSVSTGSDALLVAIVGRDAYLLRADSQLELEAGRKNGIPGVLRVVSGALLAVFATGESEADPDEQCDHRHPRHGGVRRERGEPHLRLHLLTALRAWRLPTTRRWSKRCAQKHHESDRASVYPKGAAAMIEKAPVMNHTDAELVMLESLVGARCRLRPGGTRNYLYFGTDLDGPEDYASRFLKWTTCASDNNIKACGSSRRPSRGAGKPCERNAH
jgi:hypothetical protein